MPVNYGMFSSLSEHWATPQELLGELDREFHFDDDPCPLNPETDGLSRPWGNVSFCNPPYGRKIKDWLIKGYVEYLSGKTVVFLLPSRTDTAWWHDIVMKSDDIRFLRGRLKFGGAKNSAPFPSAVVVFRGCSGG